MEFPEVFGRDNPGFDAFVGNPPFIYGKNVTRTLGESYNAFLASRTPGSTKNTDISAHFLFKAFSLTRQQGCLGLICTSSISEGDTRQAGLVQILKFGGSIYSANAKMAWPGKANVLISTVHLFSGEWLGDRLLNDEPVTEVSSFLTPAKERLALSPLEANKGVATRGVVPNGKGFFLSREEGEQLIALDKKYDLVMPFLVGDDLIPQLINRDKIHNKLLGLAYEKAVKYPEALEIVKARLNRTMTNLGLKKKIKQNWWLYEASGRKCLLRLEPTNSKRRTISHSEAGQSHSNCKSKQNWRFFFG